MMHKAWRSTEEVPYCFSGSSIKFEGHMDRKIADLNQILSKITRLVAAIKSLRFALLFWKYMYGLQIYFMNKYHLNIYALGVRQNSQHICFENVGFIFFCHDNVVTQRHFPHSWAIVREIHVFIASYAHWETHSRPLIISRYFLVLVFGRWYTSCFNPWNIKVLLYHPLSRKHQITVYIVDILCYIHATCATVVSTLNT